MADHGRSAALLFALALPSLGCLDAHAVQGSDRVAATDVAPTVAHRSYALIAASNEAGGSAAGANSRGREAGDVDIDAADDPDVELGFELELVADRLNDFSFDTEPRDDLLVREAELLAELTLRPREKVIVFGELSLIVEREDFRGDTPDESVEALERGETWVRWLQPFAAADAATLGRQAFEDPRRWWWDDDLDAVRLDYERPRWDAYLAIAQEVARVDTAEDFIDPEAEDVRRLFMHAGWSYSEALRLDVFGLVQRDRSARFAEDDVLDSERVDESDLDARWFGLRATGALALDRPVRFRYWVDLAQVAGDEVFTEFEQLSGDRSRAEETSERKLRGWALDLGGAWDFALSGEPSLDLRYARGSGDRDPEDGTDKAYRETGLRDPDDEFRLYGELLRPALSNLEVATIALGLEALPGARITLGYHRFRQLHARDELAEARIELDPTGESRDLGEEYSLVAQVDAADEVELEFAAATFRAGDAFGSAAGRRSHSLFAELTWGF